jgi:putative ABC transport system permease protein
MESLLHDMRYGLRSLRRMRSTAAIAVATLALGIAATTTMFSVVYSALVRPLPFDEPERLVVLNVVRHTASDGTVTMRWPFSKVVALRAGARSFESVATYTSAGSLSVVGAAGTEPIDGEITSAAYLHALRVRLDAGREFLPEEDAPGHPVVIVSADVWRRQVRPTEFVPGQSLLVNAAPLTIVGIAPDSFKGLTGRASVWIPIGMAPQLTYRDYLTTPQHFINLIARISPAASLSQVNAELAALGPNLPATPEAAGEPATWSAVARPIGDARIDPGLRRSSLLMLSAVACLLLVTCINVAGLLLTRARLRQREIAVRIALGAGKLRIARQLLTETAILAICGGIAGALLASWGIAWFRHVSPDLLPPTHTGYVQLGTFASPSMDGVALGFTLFLTIVCTLLAGLAPALQLADRRPAATMADASRSTTAGGQGRALWILAGAQIAIAVLLVAGALLVLSSFVNLEKTRVGFDPSRVLVFWVSPPGSRYAPDSGPAVIERLLTRVQAVPGVSLATVNRCTPFSPSCARSILFFPERPTSAELAPSIGRHYVSADYFRTLGMRLLSGRALSNEDRAGRPPVTIINETAARRFWPGQDPVGRRVWFGSATGFMDPANPVEVVGVVSDVKYWPLTEAPGPDFYTSYLQFAYPDTAVIVRSTGDPLALIPALRTAVADVDRTIPIYDVRLLDERVSDALLRPRFNAWGMSLFAAMTAILAAMGIFGAISAGVAARTRELAIRVALGATSSGLRQLVLGQAFKLAALWSVVGLAASWVLLRGLESTLFGVTAADPLLLTVATLAMIVVALLAALLPARRAGAVDPITALKAE